MLFFFNLYVLLPAFFLKKKYIKYVVVLSASSILLLILQRMIYAVGRSGIQEFSVPGFTDVLDFISSFFILLLCMLGGSMTVILKHWMQEIQQVNQLENTQIRSEMELLKEQINPELLFNILHRSGMLANKEPQIASEMLLKLSQLLRYQLYDCSRDKVLLSSEIRFLNNYLTLEKLYSNRFDYTISHEGAINSVLTPPLLFIPFVKQAVQQIYSQEECTFIQVHFKTGNDMIEFTCNFCEGRPPTEESYAQIRQRLALVYKNRYILSIKKEPDNFVKIILDLSNHA
jgi:LytS/YehU family sensor histidine kinase